MAPSSSTRSHRRPTVQGSQTRQAILQAAVNIASVEGLEGLSIGRLATELGMSKSGLFAHFGSKEDLQLATLQTALEIFSREVIQPVLAVSPGLARLRALSQVWLSYGERKVFRGGCFFAATVVEFDSRPGVVRDRLAKLMQYWLKRLTRWIQEAQDLGELPAEVDPTQLAFEIHSILWGANWMLQLYEDDQVKVRVRIAIEDRLNRSSNPQLRIE